MFVGAEDSDGVLRALKVVADPAEIGAVSVGCVIGGNPRNYSCGMKAELLKDWRGEYLIRGLSLPARYAELGPPPFTMAEVNRRLQPSGADHWLSDLCNDYGIRDSLWSVSVGGSLRASLEYVVGTLAGAVHAAAVGVLVPHVTALGQHATLALNPKVDRAPRGRVLPVEEDSTQIIVDRSGS